MRAVLAISLLIGLISSEAAGQIRRPQRFCDPGATYSGAPETARQWDDRTAYSGKPAQIVGQVVDVIGRPVPDAQLVLRDSLTDRVDRGHAYSDQGGAFSFQKVSPRAYVIQVRRLGYQQQWHELQILSGGSDTLCFRLRFLPIEVAPVVPAKGR